MLKKLIVKLIYLSISSSFNNFIFVCREKVNNLTRTYRFVVEAKRLIDWMIENSDCRSREEASILGQSMCEVGILHHGKCLY